jgi:hypothetical protein
MNGIDLPTMRKGDQDDVRRITSRPFALTRGLQGARAGLGHPLSRLLVGECAGGCEVLVFDVTLAADSTASSSSTARHYTAALAQLPARVDGRVSVSRRGFLREPIPLSAPEVEVAHDGVRSRFRVRATSEELAHELLDGGPLCDWLASDGAGFHYELAHDRVLAYGRRRLLTPRTAPLAAALHFAALVPAGALASAATGTGCEVVLSFP